MAAIKEGIIVILSSPSGAGKTTLVKKISLRNKFKISVSHTTRKSRSNEKSGKDYFFVNHKEFKELISKKKFLEYAKVFKHFYGSLKETIFKNLKNGKDVIFDIDWQGTKQIKQKKLKYKVVTIFILPPSKKELFNRLLKRERKDLKIANDRMKQFKQDVLHWKDYDFTVINDNVEKCYKEIIRYINFRKKKLKTFNYKKNFIKNHVQSLIK